MKSDAGKELSKAERFDDIVLGVLFQPLENGIFIANGLQHDYREIAELVHGMTELKPANASRHMQINNRQIGHTFFGNTIQCLFTGHGRDNIISPSGQCELHNA